MVVAVEKIHVCNKFPDYFSAFGIFQSFQFFKDSVNSVNAYIKLTDIAALIWIYKTPGTRVDNKTTEAPGYSI